ERGNPGRQRSMADGKQSWTRRGGAPAVVAVTIVRLLAARGAHAAAGAVPGRGLWDAQANGTAPVLVRLAVPTKPEASLATVESVAQQRQGIAAAQSAVRADLAGTSHRVLHQYATIPFVAIEASEDALAALERSGQVVAVQQDRLRHPLVTQSTAI